MHPPDCSIKTLDFIAIFINPMKIKQSYVGTIINNKIMEVNYKDNNGSVILIQKSFIIVNHSRLLR